VIELTGLAALLVLLHAYKVKRVVIYLLIVALIGRCTTTTFGLYNEIQLKRTPI